MIDYNYAALTDGIDEEPLMVLESSDKKDVKNLKDQELDDSIQRYKSHTQDSGLKLDKTKLNSHLELLLAEKDRREKAKQRNGARPLPQKITEKRSIDFDQINHSSTSRNVKERKTEASTSEKDVPAFEKELKFMVFARGKKPSNDAETIKKHPVVFPSTPVQKPSPDRAQELRLFPQVSNPERPAARRKSSAPEPVVVYSSDEENDVEVMEKDAACPRRTSSRIAHRRKIDRNAKVAYPSRDDPDAVELYYGDLTRLSPGEFLNDTIIDFYIKYLQRQDHHAGCGDYCHFYSSFFFKKLEEAFNSEAKQVEAFSKLRKWTKGIDIFSKSYLFFPINDRLHWSLAIVCFSMSEGVLRPFIFHLDSLLNGHSSCEIFKYIQRYLELEHAEMEIAVGIRWHEIVKKKVEVPRQQNESDCGLFLLFYISHFLETAPSPGELTETSIKFGKKWFKASKASELRSTIQEILLDLFNAT